MNPLDARRRLLGRNVYKKTAEGNPAIAQGSLARRYPGITMQGWTEQDGTPTPENPVPIVSAGNWNEETQKWEYEVKLTGANLWDKEKASIIDNWIESTSQLGYSDFAVDVLAGQKITVSFPETLSTGLGYYVGIVLKENGPIISWMYHTTAESLIAQKKTVISTENKIWIRCNLNGIEDFVSGNPQFQIEYGDKRTEFMSYLKRSVTLTSDRPLTKWDKLEKRNGQWGWAYKSGRYTVTGEEIFTSSTASYHGEQTSDAWLLVDDMFSKVWIPSDDPGGYCEKLSWNQAIWEKDGSVGFTYNVKQIHIRLNNADVGITSEDTPTDIANKIKEYVGQQYQEGNPFVFWYETTAKTFVPLSTSDQEQMNSLHTLHPTTVLSNDAGCEMSLTYKTKKSLEVTT